MTKNLRFLITGCQGDIGISISKSIRDEWPEATIYGTDLESQGSGELFFQKIVKIPKASETEYTETLQSLIDQHQIDFLIPTSEPELKFFHSQPSSLDKFRKNCILANDFSMEVGFDKLKTQNHLEAHNFPFLVTVDAKNVSEDIEFPCILKPRSASGSSGLKVIQDKQELGILNFMKGDFILQKYIASEKEFTSCVYSDGLKYKTITLERTLRYGVSITAHPILDEKVDAFLIKLAQSLNLKGSINVQFKLGNDGQPYVFEINPRFSSTVFYRHLLGFKDLIWSIEAAAGRETNLDLPVKNKRLVRYFEDVII